MNMHVAAPMAQTTTRARVALRRLVITASAYAPNEKGTGMVLSCIARSASGQEIALRYELENTDERIQEIGQRDFAGLRRATGVLSPSDTAELHDKPFKARVVGGVVMAYLFEDAPLAA